MAKLAWSMKGEDVIVATGADTGAEFEIQVGHDDYALSVAGRGIISRSPSLVDLMTEAQGMDRDEDPNNTFRDAEVPFAANH